MTDYEYDVDNIDLENEMYLNDIQEEMEQEAEALDELDDEQSTFDENHITTEKDLDYLDKQLQNEVSLEDNKKYEKLKNTAKCKRALENDLKLDEYKRQIYQINYLDVNYTGIVIHKLYEDNYVFSVTSEDNTIKNSLKKINLTKL
jgi:predicted Zn-dependent peptidase